MLLEDEEDLLPDGIYDLTSINIEQRESKASGRTYYYVTWEVVSPPYQGAHVYQPLLDLPNARWVWEAVVDHPLELMLDPDVTAQISTDVYQDKRRNRVGKLMPRVG